MSQTSRSSFAARSKRSSAASPPRGPRSPSSDELSNARTWDDEDKDSSSDEDEGGVKSARPTGDRTGDSSGLFKPIKLPPLLNSIGESAVMFSDKRANGQFCGATSGNDKICINPNCKVLQPQQTTKCQPSLGGGHLFQVWPLRRQSVKGI